MFFRTILDLTRKVPPRLEKRPEPAASRPSSCPDHRRFRSDHLSQYPRSTRFAVPLISQHSSKRHRLPRWLPASPPTYSASEATVHAPVAMDKVTQVDADEATGELRIAVAHDAHAVNCAIQSPKKLRPTKPPTVPLPRTYAGAVALSHAATPVSVPPVRRCSRPCQRY